MAEAVLIAPCRWPVRACLLQSLLQVQYVLAAL